MNQQEFEQIEKEIAGLFDQTNYHAIITLTDSHLKNKADLDNAQLAMMYFFKGAAHSELKQYDKAIANLNKAIELDPKHGKAFSYRGIAYAELKQYGEAIADFDKAIELDPNVSMIYNNRGNTYLTLKQFDKAKKDFNKAIELNPNFADPYNNRGFAYNKLNQKEQAIADYSKAIELNPNFATAYYNRGFVYFSSKDFENAEKDFSKAHEIDGQNAVYIHALQAVEDAEKREESLHQFSDTFAELSTEFPTEYDKRIEKYNKQYEKLYKSYSYYSIFLSIIVVVIYGSLTGIILCIGEIDGWSILPWITIASLMTIPLYLIAYQKNIDKTRSLTLRETTQDKKDIFIIVSGAITDVSERNQAMSKLIGYYSRVNLGELLLSRKGQNIMPHAELVPNIQPKKQNQDS